MASLALREYFWRTESSLGGVVRGVESDAYDNGTDEDRKETKMILAILLGYLGVYVNVLSSSGESLNGLPSNGFSRQSSWKLPVDAIMSKDCD